MKKLLYLLLACSFIACEKAEIPVKKPIIDNGAGSIIQVNVGSSYGDQLFFNCASESVIKVVHRDSWDLAFEASDDGFHIVPNGSRMIGTYKSTAENFADITSYTGNGWGYGRPNGNLDSTIIGDWRADNKVYVFNMGASIAGSNYPKYKLKVLSVDHEKYTIEFGKLNATTPTVAEIYKDNSRTFMQFSMLNNETISGEPEKSTWDLGFRTYTHVYPDGMPYLVVGCMLNPFVTSVAHVAKDFASIDINDIASSTFSSDIDEIGFEWKTYNFDTYLYTIHPEKCYIVKTNADEYYKLHFLDFYDDLGQKGAPKLQMQRLQ